MGSFRGLWVKLFWLFIWSNEEYVWYLGISGWWAGLSSIFTGLNDDIFTICSSERGSSLTSNIDPFLMADSLKLAYVFFEMSYIFDSTYLLLMFLTLIEVDTT